MTLSDKTKDQLESIKRKYLSSGFNEAYKYLLSVKEVHKRAILASQIKSVLKLYPSLKPNEKKYETFMIELKEWTKQRNQYYNNRKEEMVTSKSFVESCGEIESKWKKDPKNLQYVQEYMLCLLIACIPTDLIHKVDLRKMLLKKSGKKQNYFTRNYIYLNEYKQGGSYGSHKEIKIEIPNKMVKVLNCMRSLKDSVYVFGVNSPLSQPAFSQMVKRVFGVTLLQLRKMVEREDISKLL